MSPRWRRRVFALGAVLLMVLLSVGIAGETISTGRPMSTVFAFVFRYLMDEGPLPSAPTLFKPFKPVHLDRP